MKNAYIATYPPRQCGIGTFTENLFNSMVASDIDEPNHKKSFIVAINDSEEELTYPEEVRFTDRKSVV